MPIPQYFVRERMRVLRDREKMLAHVMAKGGHIEQVEQVRETHYQTPLCKQLLQLLPCNSLKKYSYLSLDR